MHFHTEWNKLKLQIAPCQSESGFATKCILVQNLEEKPFVSVVDFRIGDKCLGFISPCINLHFLDLEWSWASFWCKLKIFISSFNYLLDPLPIFLLGSLFLDYLSSCISWILMFCHICCKYFLAVCGLSFAFMIFFHSKVFYQKKKCFTFILGDLYTPCTHWI